jgi:hypothetical protein
MPLTVQKAAHINTMLRKAWAQRSQTVDLHLRIAGGGTSVLTVSSIWRVLQDADPSLGPAYGDTAKQMGDVDVSAIFFVADVTLAQMRSCLYAQLTAGQGIGVQPATKYTLTSIEVKGLLPGGSRYLTHWIRQEP